ncbi:hypothetical protein ACIGNX_23370 [Actinosynnema sp. NPDC053489]|uniref:hypothetical protein n=1 Tax=Actinosynnema sp. NPDC053489 TaxID=3363916 RepID=UPI0037C5ED97
MARRPAAAKNQIGALPLALTSAAAYLLLAGAAAYLSYTANEPTLAAATTPGPTTPGPTTPGPTTPGVTAPPPTSPTSATPPSAPPPPDTRRITAPGGLTTTIPADWTVTPGTVATTLVATDPTAPARELRLGGAPVTDPATPLLDRITAAATDREREPGHRRLTLTGTTIRDHPAVTWEFEENAGAPDAKRVATAFWEANGVEYVLYSAGPPREWDLTKARLTRMVDTATP